MRSEITKYIWWVGIQSTASWETCHYLYQWIIRWAETYFLGLLLEWNAQDSGGQTTDLKAVLVGLCS